MQNYHRHTSYSNIYIADSAVMNEDYAKRAVELGHKIISSCEHGWQGYYFETFELAKKYNLKFVFCAEAYWVKDRISEYPILNNDTGEYEKNKDGSIRRTKDKTNCHIILMAKNENGRQSINDILSTANEDGYYFRPRVDLGLLLSLPKDDVMITSACIAFNGYDDSEETIKKLYNHFGNNFYLEIQYHNTEKQKDWNHFLKQMASKYGIELIVGLDSHYITDDDSIEREYILEAKNIKYPDENGWYMDYPDDETTMNRFLEQGVFTKEQIQRAMDNTDVCLTFDDYDDIRIFNKDIKLPSLYPDLSQDEKNKLYSRFITKMFKDYMKNVPKEDYDKYFEGVKAEVEVYKNTGMVDYPLLDYEIIKRGVEMGGVITKTGRGSAPSFFTNTLCGFSSIDRFTSPVKLYPERFISEARILETKSLPDIDMNVSDQDIFAKAQEEILGGIEHACPMIAFGTFKKKSAFKLYARAKKMDFELANSISSQFDAYEEAVKYAEDGEEIDVFDYIDEEFREYVEKSIPYWGIISDKKKAPCGYLLYDGNIRKEIGLIKCKSESTNKEYITCVIDGAIAENYKFLKNDLLKVDVVLLIDKICKRIGIEQPTVNELLELTKYDDKVWDLYKNGYTIGLNQAETPAGTRKIMKYAPKNISELSAWVAAIRPGFKSMYNKFESREDFKYEIPSFDKLIQTEELPVSFLFYQEQVMNTLNFAGFPMDECYGIIKAIAKKHPEKVKPLKARFIKGFIDRLIEDGSTEEEAELNAQKVWQIINDNCAYSFNSSHAVSVALDNLYSAWQKANFPYEFYEVMLQHYADKGNKDKVALIKSEMLKAFNIREGLYKFGLDNRRFIADKYNHCINPALVGIKGLSQTCANDLYDLSNKKTYTDFMSLYKDLLKIKSLNISKINTLILIGYFSEFGEPKQLLKQAEMFNTIYDKKQIKKDKLDEFGIPVYLAAKYCDKETDKMYKFSSTDDLLNALFENTVYEETTILDKIRYQSEYLGYISLTRPKMKECYYYVQSIDKNMVSLYQIKTGDTIKIKFRKNDWNSDPFYEQQIIRVDLVTQEKKWGKNSDGEWIRKDETEDILKKWSVIKE